MNYKAPRLGIDRFLALRWADMALDLYMVNDDKSKARKQFRNWLSQEIDGQISADKTAYQINRIWLIENDPFEYLRIMAISNGITNNHRCRSILHYGLAVNVFPFFANVCRVTGRLLNLQPSCTNRDIYQRVHEIYGNPASIERASHRTIQTLIDWGLLTNRDGGISTKEILVSDSRTTEWLLTALISAHTTDRIPLVDIVKAPELLGIRFEDARAAIRSASFLRLEYANGFEMISVTNEQD
jgi:hypothetical protein